MPCYELVCIAAHNPQSPVYLRQMIGGIARMIHANGGVVRDLKNLGIGVGMPSKVKRHSQVHTRGDYFTMLFDTSPVTLKKIDEQLNRDPVVVKWTLLKKGDKILLPSSPFSVQHRTPLDKGNV